ncbi:MAG TPA: hypothetical protein VGW12_04915 [Pyrinomonadaceae bacterium]|nr:hypothetical protein [Pyrinomonadaceae bacterium]
MRKVTLLMVAAAFILIIADGALACSCAYSSPSQGFDRAQAVFTGKVVRAKGSEWVVAVDKVWKGEVRETTTLRDAHAGTSCASSYKKGASYLFLVDVEVSERGTVYHPQVCNWGTMLKASRVEAGGNTESWVEDIVLKDRGEGKPPIKKGR